MIELHHLTDLERELAKAWRTASDELGINVETLGAATDCDGRRIVFAVRLSDFGSPSGMVCRHRRSPDGELVQFSRWARDVGLYYSLLDDPYTRYERDLYIDTLNDWGWYGSGLRPDWYEGLTRADQASAPRLK